MWNGHEWGTFFKNLGKGILWGIGAMIFLVVYSLFSETWNCLCNLFCSGGCSFPEVRDGNVLVYGFLICVVIGIIVGIVQASQFCKERVTQEREQIEQGNYTHICARLGELSKNATAANGMLGVHKKDIFYHESAYRDSVTKQVNDNERLYQLAMESYEGHTEIQKKGETE